MSKVICVSDTVYLKLSQMAQVTDYSMQDIIDQAVRSLEREIILKQANESYGRVRNNKKELQQYQEAFDGWESTLGDGLEDQ